MCWEITLINKMKQSFNNFIDFVKEFATDVIDIIQDKSNWPYFFALILFCVLLNIIRIYSPDFILGWFAGVVMVGLMILFKE